MSLPSDAPGSISPRAILRSRPLVAGLVCVFLGALDLTVIASILSTIIPDLGVNTADIDRYIWVVNGYLIAYIVAIPLVGRLSDIVGRRTAFAGCLLVFAVGSLVCARAGSLESLIVGRTIQGLGGGGLLPVTLALAGDVLPPRMRLAGIGLVSATDTLGWVLGPTYGALVSELLPVDEPWRWVFWLNLPLLALALVVVARGFPRHADGTSPAGARTLDLPGALLLTGALITLNLALASGGEFGGQTGTGLRALGGTPNPLAERVPLLLAIAVICIAGLVWWERRARVPILPVGLLRRASYVASIVANFLIGAALMIGMVNVPVIVALVRDPGTVSRDSAALLAPFTLGIALFAFMSGQIAARIGTRRMTEGGVALTVIGFIALYALVDRDNLARMAIGLSIAGAGIGVLLAPLSDVALAEASAQDRGAAASTALVFRLLGMTLGISALTAVGVARLQSLTSRLEPVVRGQDESTAGFLERQHQFIEDHAIPLSVQVIQETFLAAAVIAALAIVPVLAMRRGAKDL